MYFRAIRNDILKSKTAVPSALISEKISILTKFSGEDIEDRMKKVIVKMQEIGI